MNETPVNDTSEGRSIAVIATRMPYIDRRSLSEAWFSALHLASDGAVSPKPAERRVADAGVETAHAPKTERSGAQGTAVRASGLSAAARTARAATEPRVATLAGARRLRSDAAFARARSYAPFHTSLTLGIDGERVALLLRREGATLHVVALCRPAVADLVRRALGCADLSLRSRGESVCSRVEVLPNGVRA